MKITFMIGNGFDLKLGLKTKFTDFYDTYFKSELDRDVPDSVKNFILLVMKDKETFGSLDKWSDFEKAFAENIQGTVEEVGEILEDFTVQFAEYLRKEEEKCDYSDENIIGIFFDFLSLSFNFLKMRDKLILKNFLKGKIRSTFIIRFINFNYTSTLDKLVLKTKSFFDSIPLVEDPEDINTTYDYEIELSSLHIHGDLISDVVIGVDSKDQFKHQIIGSKKVEDFAVKKTINYNSGNENRDVSFNKIVEESDIIYMYGLSLGETDKSHWDIIRGWIKNFEDHKLIFFLYASDLKKIKSIYAPKVRLEINKLKNEVLIKLGFSLDELESYYDQIFIIDSSDVLNFKLVDENKEPEANMN